MTSRPHRCAVARPAGDPQGRHHARRKSPARKPGNAPSATWVVAAIVLLDCLLDCKYEKQMLTEALPLAPPPGFRKAIPDKVKLEVVIQQHSLCATCGERLGKLADTQFDHVPAVQLRCWDPEAKDTIPPSNDKGHIFAKHVDCHAQKTFGSKASKRGADVTEIARTKRIARYTEDFRRRMLAKLIVPEEAIDEAPKRPKKQWPKRPFPKRGKDGKSRSRGEEGTSEAEG